MNDLKDIEHAIKERDADWLKKLAAADLKIDTQAKTIEEQGVKLKGLDAQQFEMMQKMLAGGGGDGFGANSGRHGKSLGEQFINSEGFKQLAGLPEQSRKGHRADHIVKATLTSLSTDVAGSVGSAVVPATQPIDLLPRRRLVVRDLIPQINISSGSVEVPVQKVSTNNAGMVAEGAAKPESDMQLELKVFPARVIAHWMKASRQIIDDVPQLRGLIDSELIYGLALKEEAQLLSGDNTGQNLYGMIPQATAYSDPLVGVAGAPAIDNYIDIIGRAMLQNANAEYPADGVIMHSSDWMAIRLTKDSEGAYIYGPPGGAEPVPRIFGAPVVPTQAMTIDKFLVGQFQRAATIYDRWEARVELGFVDDDFIKNLVTLLGEERLAFAVRRPLALTYGDFSDAMSL